jgi:NADPH2:quinone reductase
MKDDIHVFPGAAFSQKAELARHSGADLVLRYRHPAFLNGEVMKFTHGRGVDMIIEVNASANAPLHPGLLAFGGRVVVYGSPDAEIPVSYRGMMRRFASLHFFLVYLLNEKQLEPNIAACSRLLAEQTLRHQPAVIFSLGDIAAAHEHVERGKPGKVLIDLEQA